MKMSGSKFWGVIALAFASLIVITAGSAVWFKLQLTAAELKFITLILEQNIGPVLLIGFFFLGIGVWSLTTIFRSYVRPIPKLAEKITLINSSNPSYRLPGLGGGDIQRLCDRINEAAQRYESLSTYVEERVQRARADSEQEKNTLAAIVAELPEGVLICNPEGRILLYNNQAKSLLSGSP
jgi:DNA polymerase-3 subunit epsilon